MDKKDAALEQKAHALLDKIKDAKAKIAGWQEELIAVHDARVARAAELVAEKEAQNG